MTGHVVTANTSLKRKRVHSIRIKDQDALAGAPSLYSLNIPRQILSIIMPQHHLVRIHQRLMAHMESSIARIVHVGDHENHE